MSVALSGEWVLRAARGYVFDALHDQEILRQAIPGCERIVRLDETRYECDIAVSAGPVAGTFRAHLHVYNLDVPRGYSIEGEASAGEAVGGARGNAHVALAVIDGGTTNLAYHISATPTGRLAELPSAVLGRTAQLLVDAFLERLAHLVESDYGGETPEESVTHGTIVEKRSFEDRGLEDKAREERAFEDQVREERAREERAREEKAVAQSAPPMQTPEPVRPRATPHELPPPALPIPFARPRAIVHSENNTISLERHAPSYPGRAPLEPLRDNLARATEPPRPPEPVPAEPEATGAQWNGKRREALAVGGEEKRNPIRWVLAAVGVVVIVLLLSNNF